MAEKETIWSRADSGQCKSCKGKRVTLELEGQFEGGGARRVPRCATLSRQTQLIGRIRRECCKIQSSPFSHLSNPKCCRSFVESAILLTRRSFFGHNTDLYNCHIPFRQLQCHCLNCQVKITSHSKIALSLPFDQLSMSPLKGTSHNDFNE